MTIVIARHVNGVTLNPLEFLLESDSSSDYMQFESEEAACQFLRDNGITGTDEELKESHTFMTVKEALDYEGKPFGKNLG